MGQAYSQQQQAGEILTIAKKNEGVEDEFEKEIQSRVENLSGVTPLIQQQSSSDSIWREMTFAQITQERSNFVKSFVDMFQCYTQYVQDQVKKAKQNQETIHESISKVQTKGKQAHAAINKSAGNLDECILDVSKMIKAKRDLEQLKNRINSANQKLENLQIQQQLKHSEPHTITSS